MGAEAVWWYLYGRPWAGPPTRPVVFFWGAAPPIPPLSGYPLRGLPVPALAGTTGVLPHPSPLPPGRGDVEAHPPALGCFLVTGGTSPRAARRSRGRGLPSGLPLMERHRGSCLPLLPASAALSHPSALLFSLGGCAPHTPLSGYPIRRRGFPLTLALSLQGKGMEAFTRLSPRVPSPCLWACLQTVVSLTLNERARYDEARPNGQGWHVKKLGRKGR